MYMMLCLQWLGSSNSGGRDDCETEAISLDSCASVLEPFHLEGLAAFEIPLRHMRVFRE